MKGHLFTILRDAAGGDRDYNPTMGALLRHPLVVQSIWGHPLIAFFDQNTSFKDPATGEWEPELPGFLSDAAQAVRLTFRPSAEVDLEAYFATKMGTIAHGGRDYVLASTFPQAIPVIMRGTRSFDSVRTFDVEGLRWEPGTEPDTKRLNPTYFARYVVALVLNMDNGDARHYRESSRAVVEHLTTARAKVSDTSTLAPRATPGGILRLPEAGMSSSCSSTAGLPKVAGRRVSGQDSIRGPSSTPSSPLGGNMKTRDWSARSTASTPARTPSRATPCWHIVGGRPLGALGARWSQTVRSGQSR